MFEENPNVLYAERDYELRAFMAPPPADPPADEPPAEEPPEEKPIDPKLSEQWGLNNEGQTGGNSDADINAPQMWENISGEKDVIIAVIDTGIDYNHPDLVDNMWVNPGEIAGNGIDDDGNDVVDDIHGYNAVSDNGDMLIPPSTEIICPVTYLDLAK
jgi:subtilisin family serine protease